MTSTYSIAVFVGFMAVVVLPMLLITYLSLGDGHSPETDRETDEAA